MLLQKEEQLIAHIDDFLAGDESAFDKVAHLIGQDIMNITYRYAGNFDDAKDICQEVLFKLYKKLKTFRRASKISTWMYRVAVNASIDFLRKKKKTVVLEEEITQDEGAGNAALQQIEKNDVKERVTMSVAKLPLRQKNVLILKHFEGLKINQISKIIITVIGKL